MITSDLSLRVVTKRLFLVAAVLVCLDLAGLAFEMLTGHDTVFGLLGLIDLDGEKGIGALFQVLLLFGCACLLVLLGRLARAGRADAGPWWVLAGIFFFLTLDEFASFHEELTIPLKQIASMDGVFHFAWVIPYGLAVIALGIWLLPKILAIRPVPRRWLFLAAIAYVGGALVMEMIGGWRVTVIRGAAGGPDLWYRLATTLEEGLEMTGLILFSRGILELLRPGLGQVHIRLVD